MKGMSRSIKMRSIGEDEVERAMSWKKLLAYITGSVDQELLLCNEYLVTENRLPRKQIPVLYG